MPGAFADFSSRGSTAFSKSTSQVGISSSELLTCASCGHLAGGSKRQSPKNSLIDGQVVCYHLGRYTEPDFCRVVRTARSRTCTSSFDISNLEADKGLARTHASSASHATPFWGPEVKGEPRSKESISGPQVTRFPIASKGGGSRGRTTHRRRSVGGRPVQLQIPRPSQFLPAAPESPGCTVRTTNVFTDLSRAYT